MPFLTVGAHRRPLLPRAGSVAYGFGLFSRKLSFEDYAVDVPRQRRARRRRIARALDPALGRPRPRPPENWTGSVHRLRAPRLLVVLVAEVALEVFGEGFARREVVLVEPVVVVFVFFVVVADPRFVGG